MAAMLLISDVRADHSRPTQVFTVAESGVYTLLMDDELAMELGAQILGSVGGVFVNADWFQEVDSRAWRR